MTGSWSRSSSARRTSKLRQAGWEKFVEPLDEMTPSALAGPGYPAQPRGRGLCRASRPSVLECPHQASMAMSGPSVRDWGIPQVRPPGIDPRFPAPSRCSRFRHCLAHHDGIDDVRIFSSCPATCRMRVAATCSSGPRSAIAADRPCGTGRLHPDETHIRLQSTAGVIGPPMREDGNHSVPRRLDQRVQSRSVKAS